MKNRLFALCLALPLAACFAGCDNSETATAPNGGKKVDNSKDAPPAPPVEGAGAPAKKGPSQGATFGAN